MLKHHKIIAAAVSTAALLTACGGSSDAPGSVTPAQTTTPSSVNKAPSAPKLTSATSTSLVALRLSWEGAIDDSTAAAQINYEIHASTTEGFAPSSATLVRQVIGVTSTDVVTQTLGPESKQYVRVVAVDKQGLKTLGDSKVVVIEGISVSPNRAGQGVPTLFTIKGTGLPANASFSLENCTATMPPPRQVDTTGTTHLFSCAPKVGGNTVLKATVKTDTGVQAAGFSVTATDTPPVTLNYQKLKFKQERIQVARVPINSLSGIAFPPALLLQCSKVEMKRVSAIISVPETRCPTECFLGVCTPNLFKCTTEWVRKEVSTDVPTAYIGDQEFKAEVSMNMPEAGLDADQIKSDINQIINANIKSAINNHVNSSINGLKDGIQQCAVKAGALAVGSGAIAGWASGSTAAVSAATTTFVQSFEPCAIEQVEKAGERLANVSEALNAVTQGTKRDLQKYLGDKINEIKPKLEFGSQCTNWRPL